MVFFLHTQIPDCQIVSYPNKYTNGKFIYSAFRCCINLNCEKLTLMTGLWSRVTYSYLIPMERHVQVFILTYMVANIE